MNVKELKAFRAKLVAAKKSAKPFWLADGPLSDAGLHMRCSIKMPRGYMVNDQNHKFVGWCRRNGLKAVHAMYDNSIAAIDAQIEKGKS